MEDLRLARLLGWWADGQLTDAEVVAWADHEIASAQSPSAIPAWVLELSLRGPRACGRDSGLLFPPPTEYSFAERLAARASVLDLSDESAAISLARWVSTQCMGRSLDDPAVSLGYYVDHLLNDCGRYDLATAHLRAELGSLPAVAESPSLWRRGVAAQPVVAADAPKAARR